MITIQFIDDAIVWQPYDRAARPKLLPGALVRSSGGTVELVGDINGLGGVCDCCCDLYEVTHYSTSLCDALAKTIEAASKVEP